MGFLSKFLGKRQAQEETGKARSPADEWEQIQAAAPQMVRIMRVIKEDPELIKEIRALQRSESGLMLGVGGKAGHVSHAERLRALARTVAESEDSVYDYEQWIGYHLEDILVEFARRKWR